jgi:hypothetical protein
LLCWYGYPIIIIAVVVLVILIGFLFESVDLIKGNYHAFLFEDCILCAGKQQESCKV